MFDIGASEVLLTAIVAIVVIGPKDMPRALRTAGRWIGKMRRISGHFRTGLENMIREAELEEMEQKWREQNEAIMRAHPDALQTPPDPPLQLTSPDAPHAASAEAAAIRPAAEDNGLAEPAESQPSQPASSPAAPVT